MVSIGDTISSGMVANGTLGYCIQTFLLGWDVMRVDNERLRFEQYMDKEMAPYACNCWDAELTTSYERV